MSDDTLAVWKPGSVSHMLDDRYVRVAWHGGGAQKLRTGKAHIADTHGPRQTLCGRTWRRSTEVVPDTTWTTGECSRCASRLLAKHTGSE